MIDESLVKSSLSEIKQIFCELESSRQSIPPAFYRAYFIGPWWLRAMAKPSIALGGLKGWQGKEFISEAQATNILELDSLVIKKLQMSLVDIVSNVDAQQGMALDYGKDAPVPWRWIKDEVRVLDANTLLCMTVIDLPLLRHFQFPFVLCREL